MRALVDLFQQELVGCAKRLQELGVIKVSTVKRKKIAKKSKVRPQAVQPRKKVKKTKAPNKKATKKNKPEKRAPLVVEVPTVLSRIPTMLAKDCEIQDCQDCSDKEAKEQTKEKPRPVYKSAKRAGSKLSPRVREILARVKLDRIASDKYLADVPADPVLDALPVMVAIGKPKEQTSQYKPHELYPEQAETRKLDRLGQIRQQAQAKSAAEAVA